MSKLTLSFLFCFVAGILFAGQLLASPQLSANIVISQVYGGAGSATGTYTRDYVELFNRSTGPVSLNGLVLQYGSSSGNFGSAATLIYPLPNVTLNAGQYFLVTSSLTTGLAPLPIAGDFVTVTALNMSGTQGKIALTNTSVALGCGITATPCVLPDARIIDLVAFGGSNNAEGGASVNGGVNITATQGSVRNTMGCDETDNNNVDFTVVTTPVPRNTATVRVPCVAVANTMSQPACAGIAPSPLQGNKADKALLCFTLNSNWSPDFTGINIPFTTDPSVRFTNARLIKSTDTDFTTTGDNSVVANGTIDSAKIAFTGFTAFSGTETIFSNLIAATPSNFFVVVDIANMVSPATPNSQPSADTPILSHGILSSVTPVGLDYSFAFAPTAADASVRGRLLTPAGRGLSNATIILTDTNSGQVRYARSTSLGYFNFRDLESGDFYVLSVKSKSYTFVNQSFTLNENIDDLILTAQ
jgi:Lamin Tail Domain/Carboxypeptidase regulatory-like domain